MTESLDHLKQQREDHELLIRIDEKLKVVGSDIKDLRDNLTSRVSVLETKMLSKEEASKLVSDADDVHEEFRVEIDSLKAYKSFLVGGLFVLASIVIPLVVYIWNTKGTSQQDIRDGVASALSEYEVQIK